MWWNSEKVGGESMKIRIVTPEEYQEEYVKILREATNLMRKQGRSCERYARRVENLLNKAAAILAANRV